MTALIGVPSWAVGIIVALLFCFWWVLEELVRVRRRIKGARFGLAKLRREGVALRNEGRCITNTKALDDWKRHVDDWNNRTIAGIEKINEADAEWFSILDVVPPPRLEIEKTISIDLIASANHHKAYNEHDLRVKRLGRMLYKVWER